MSKCRETATRICKKVCLFIKESACFILELLCALIVTIGIAVVVYQIANKACCQMGLELDLTPFSGEILSALVTIWVALLAVGNITRELKNTNKTRIAEKRVEWIEDFRENVQTFLSLCSTVFDNDRTRDEQASKQSAMSGAGQDSTSPIQVYREEYIGIRAAEAGIRLRLYGMQESEGIDVNKCRDCKSKLQASRQNGNQGSGVYGDCLDKLKCPFFEQMKGADALKWAEKNLPICMHRMTRIIGLKPGSEGIKAFEKELKSCGEKESLSSKELEKMFSVCYDGIASMTALILKHEWERSKTLDGELFD